MVQQMKKYLKQGWQLFQDTLNFFRKGIKENLFNEYFKAFLATISPFLGKFHYKIQTMSIDDKEQFAILQKKIKGLHSLLPNPSFFSYSILIEITTPSVKLLESCLSSACQQTAINLEILIGSKKTLSQEILNAIQEIKRSSPHKIQLFDFSHLDIDEPIYNLLVKNSQGNFLLFLEQEDWIRPDLIYRYEQVLRTLSYPENSVINCYENYINEKDSFLPIPPLKKSPPSFPYIFHSPFGLKGLLLSQTLWKRVQGLRKEFLGAEVEDLILRLNLSKACFTTIPLALYSQRLTRNSYKKSMDLKSFTHALKDYTAAKNLDWSFEKGYKPHHVRAIPQKTRPHKTQIIIPFKDQKDLTLKCIACVMKQKEANFKITAIDNGSHDLSIAEAIRKLDGEVLWVDEPFNYSRLNNLAVAKTQQATDCDLLLFLNNDVELDENALSEMINWVDQPSIGMVGARLHYPNGLLQHGGIDLDQYHMPESLWWKHREKLSYFDEMDQTKSYALVDAVTTACALIKKEVFLDVGRFDEICYPIAYSDTNLATKLSHKGLHCFYTPYASGIHHESISRKLSLEDFDISRWLYQLNHKRIN